MQWGNINSTEILCKPHNFEIISAWIRRKFLYENQVTSLLHGDFLLNKNVRTLYLNVLSLINFFTLLQARTREYKHML